MKLSTYHSHTNFCDGKESAEEMIVGAIKLGCPEIGISGHSPLPFKSDWAMKNAQIPEYIQTLEELREKYKDQIKVYIGIEQDYYSYDPDWKPDYIIGSVHYIEVNGEYLPVDLSPEATRANIDEYFDGDPYAYCEAYYDLVADVYNKTKCDIIGHFDLVLKFNEKMPLIDTNHPRYIEAVNKAINALLQTPAHFEINTGAISRGYRKKPYPDEPLILQIAQTGHIFVLNSDAHESFHIGWLLDEYARIFDKIGIKYITRLEEIL